MVVRCPLGCQVTLDDGDSHQIILLPPADMRTPVKRAQWGGLEDHNIDTAIRTEAVNPQVVPVVFPQDLDLARPLAQREAINKQDKLDAYTKADELRPGCIQIVLLRTPRSRNFDERSEVERVPFLVAIASYYRPCRLNEDNQVHGSHANDVLAVCIARIMLPTGNLPQGQHEQCVTS